jgi:hypothetical protein
MHNWKRNRHIYWVLFLISSIFLPIHIYVLYYGQTAWYLGEIALIGGIMGCWIVYSDEDGELKMEKKRQEIALVGPFSATFAVAWFLGPFFWAADRIAKNVLHAPIFEFPSFWAIFFTYLIGFELFYWIALYLSPKIENRLNKGMDRQ